MGHAVTIGKPRRLRPLSGAGRAEQNDIHRTNSLLFPAPGFRPRANRAPLLVLFQESFVVLHHHLRLQLLFKFHCHRHHDQDTRRGEHVDEVIGSPGKHDGRNERDQRKIDGAEQRNTVGNLFQISLRRFSGTNALDKAAVLLNALGHVLGIELHLRIEERKCKIRTQRTTE